MAKKEEIEILISEDGYIKFHIREIKGPKCMDLAKILGKSLGELKDVSLTSEYYEKEETKIIEKSKQKLK